MHEHTHHIAGSLYRLYAGFTREWLASNADADAASAMPIINHKNLVYSTSCNKE